MHDPQDMNPQYLEDLATGYWHSEVLFTAVEKSLFTRLEPNGKKIVDLAWELGFDPGTLKRFIHALSIMGLVFEADGLCGNTKLARKYLVQGAEAYQGESILWRKFLIDNWKTLDRCLEKGTRVLFQTIDEPETAVKERFRKYCRAMDCIARNKIEEILPMFSGLKIQGDILDIGSGLGAFSVGFLKEFPETKATLVDMEQVVEYAAETHGSRSYTSRMEYRATNILEPWALPKKYNLIILSNIVHAFAEAETGHVMAQAVTHLAEDGLILVHDFFMEHAPEKAVLSDLNMLVNTYNGKVYAAAWVREQLEDAGLKTTELIPLESDTAILIASKKAASIAGLRVSHVQQVTAKIQSLGFQAVKQIDIDSIEVPDWVGAKCEFGCDGYGLANCPPNCIKPEKTRAMLKNYSKCLLLQGVPPTGDFQRLVLRAERAAFKAGYYKAFSLWAGPCSICDDVCAGEGTCTNHKNARPSMEASGIDVFETVRRAGFSLQTLPEKDDYVKYFAILLLE
jgi:predicted metal-binding protein/cyclopropane fatty-acyl-phospholipid synthase-like methyltransferase